MITGIFTYSDRLQAVVMRDNLTLTRRPEARFEVCFAKINGVGRNGVAEYPFSGGNKTSRANRQIMTEWCDRAGIEVYDINPAGVAFPNEQDQLLCYLAWK
jgi:hypothetical protein